MGRDLGPGRWGIGWGGGGGVRPPTPPLSLCIRQDSCGKMGGSGRVCVPPLSRQVQLVPIFFESLDIIGYDWPQLFGFRRLLGLGLPQNERQQMLVMPRARAEVSSFVGFKVLRAEEALPRNPEGGARTNYQPNSGSTKTAPAMVADCK